VSFALRFRREVPDDIEEACRWYNEQRPGLRHEFLAELKASLARIAENPQMYATGYRSVRSARLHRFPYVVHYRIHGETVVVLAVLHGSRDPALWRRRARESDA